MLKSRYKNSLTAMVIALSICCSSARAGKIDWIDDAATIGIGLITTIGLGVITYHLASSNERLLATEESLDQILQMLNNLSSPISNASSWINDAVTNAEVDDTVFREILEMLSYIKQNISLGSESVANDLAQITPILEDIIAGGIEGIRSNVTQMIESSPNLGIDMSNMCSEFSSQIYYTSMAWVNSVYGFGVSACVNAGIDYGECLGMMSGFFAQAKQAY